MFFNTDQDDVIYNFCGKDTCTILGYSNYHKALKTHVPEECKNTLSNLGYPNLGQSKLSHNELQIYINEEGLYRLIFNCQLPVAKKFQKWIFKEVLPTIRKTGKFEPLRIWIKTNKQKLIFTPKNQNKIKIIWNHRLLNFWVLLMGL